MNRFHQRIVVAAVAFFAFLPCLAAVQDVEPRYWWQVNTFGAQVPFKSREEAFEAFRAQQLAENGSVVHGYEPNESWGTLNGTWKQYVFRYSGAFCTNCFGNFMIVAPECPVGTTAIVDTPSPGHDTQYCRAQWWRTDPDLKECPAGNPVYPSTGLKRETQTDYEGVGGDLRFVRIYRSDRNGWLHNYQASLVDISTTFGSDDPPRACMMATSSSGLPYCFRYASAAPNDVIVRRADGRVLTFNSVTGLPSASDTNDRVARVTGTGGATIGWSVYNSSDDSTEYFDASGRLQTITARDGRQQFLTYSDGATSSTIAPFAGLLIRVTDFAGKQLNFTYDSAGRMQTMTDPAGGTYTYAYDESTSVVVSGASQVGNLTSVTYPDQSSRHYWYNEQDKTANTNLPFALTGITDENGIRYATFTYDSFGRALSTAHANGVQQYGFSYSSGQTIVTDPLGTARTHAYTSVLGVPKVSSVSGRCASGCSASAATSYDANANVSSRTDFNGNVTNYSYDLTRNLETSRIEAYGTPRARTISTAWHSTYRLPTLITEPGKTTAFTHDANGNVLTKTETDTATSTARTWTYAYNSFGRVSTADGPRTDVSDVTTYTYYTCTTGYQCGQVHTITNAAGHVTTFNTYNSHGQPLTITDPNGLVTTLTYDLRMRLISRTVGGEQTAFEYWPTGLLKKTTLPDSSFLSYSYDAAHRLTGIADAEGNHITYTLDPMGNRTGEEVFDPSSTLTQTRTRMFNSLNRLWKEIGAAGSPSTVEFGYDNNGNRTSIDAPLDRSTAQTYDELNRLKQVTDPMLGVTQYGYNALDQLISVTDPRSNTTSYTYDALGDLMQQVSPDTGTTTNTYDSGGNLHTSTDARSKIATYTYDELNRITSVTYPDQTISYTYDTGTNQNGRLTQVSDASGSTSWTYDAHGRVLSRQQSMGSITKTVGYDYDPSGRLEKLTLPSGHFVQFSYANGKIAGLELDGSTTVLDNVLYEPFGPVSGWNWGNNTLAVRAYDQDGRIAQLDSAGLRTYTYDKASRIAAIVDNDAPSLSRAYTYDRADRLAGVSTEVPELQPSTTTPGAGQTITVTLHGAPAGSGYWLALASTASPATTYVSWAAVVASGGTFVWNIAMPSVAGTYEVRLFKGSFDLVSTSVPITVSTPTPPAQPSLYLNVGTTLPGATVTLRLAGSPGGDLDWLAVAQVGAPDTSYLQWTYVGSGVTSREWTVTLPGAENQYEFRLFQNNGYTRLATSSPIQLTDDAPVTSSGPSGYVYDLNGNRVSGDGSNYTTASMSNRLLSVSGAVSRSYSYDAAGNVTSDGTVTFTYNDAARMASATKAGVTTTYSLNALGQRVKRTTSGSSTYFVYDEAGHLVGEYDNSGGMIEETIWFGDMPVAVLKPNGGGGVNVFYIHTDHLNTPRRISRPSDNAVLWRWDSDPFGTTAANEDPEGDSILFRYNLRFPGQYFDAESGLHYNYFRDYDPATGRYVESDPIGLKGGLNTYGYVSANPLSAIDPFGLADCDVDEQECEDLLRIDTDTCNAITKRRGARAGEACHASASQRYAACRRGNPLPPLNTWNNREALPFPEPPVPPSMDPDTQRQLGQGVTAAGIALLLLRLLPLLAL